MCIYHSCTYPNMFSSGIGDYQWDLKPPNESWFVVIYLLFSISRLQLML